MFKEGDTVVCINDGYINTNPEFILNPTPRLVKGREYIVYGITNCKCGEAIIDVGLYAESLYPMICSICERTIPNIDNSIHWCSASRFRKVEKKKEYIAVTSNVEVEEPILN